MNFFSAVMCPVKRANVVHKYESYLSTWLKLGYCAGEKAQEVYSGAARREVRHGRGGSLSSRWLRSCREAICSSNLHKFMVDEEERGAKPSSGLCSVKRGTMRHSFHVAAAQPMGMLWVEALSRAFLQCTGRALPLSR